MGEEVKTGEMTELDDSITVDEDYTLYEGKAVAIDDDSDNITSDEEIYKEALEIKESLDEIRTELKEKLLNILDKGKLTVTDTCVLELLQDQYSENFNALKRIVNSKLPGGKGSSTESIETTMDYNEVMDVICEHADWMYADEDGKLALNGKDVFGGEAPNQSVLDSIEKLEFNEDDSLALQINGVSKVFPPKLDSIEKLEFNEAGELVIQIGGVSKVFSPKA